MPTYTIRDLHSKKEHDVRAANINNLRARLMGDWKPKSGKPVDLMVYNGNKSVGIFQARYNTTMLRGYEPIYVWRKANGDVSEINPNGTIPPTR